MSEETGEALNAAVAIEVMGWQRKKLRGILGGEFWQEPRGGYLAVESWYPSEDLVAAWLVVEAMREHGWSFGLWTVCPVSSICPAPCAGFVRSVYPPEFQSGQAPAGCYYASSHPEYGNPARAICLAALKAVRAALPPEPAPGAGDAGEEHTAHDV